jgi:para-nitrobenzyl esterase
VLSQKGLVVVNFNYRLGVFGMLAHPELSRESTMGVSGNYALLDMVAAIKWTRRNIAKFGGDPNRITLYGESVGARAASALSISPLVKGDLHGVIAGDTVFGFSIATADTATAERAGVEFLKVAGAASIRDLRSMPVDDLIAASSKFMEHGNWIEFIVDGWALPGNIAAAEKSGAANEIPILTGSTADFATVLVDPVPAKEFVAASRKTYGELADRFLTLYPARTDVEATASQWAAVNDFIAWEHNEWATVHTRAGHRAYVYFFTHAVPPPSARTTFKGGRLPPKLGAYHTGEIPYAFDSLAKVDRSWTSADKRLADIMSSYWVNFAAKGDPNGPGLPSWPIYEDAEGPAMELGDEVRRLPRVLDKVKTQFWTDYFATKTAN